jgi:hypothetical protein
MKLVSFAKCFAVAALAVASMGAFAQNVPTWKTGADVVASTPVVSGVSSWYFNDSVFPYLPSADGSTNILFWGDAWAHRYAGPDLMHMQPSPGTLVTRVRVGGLPSDSTAYDSNGDWMNEAHRLSDGSLVAFVHAENHNFATGTGQWNSTGLWISEDDGYTWTDYGRVVGSPQPTNGTDSGLFGGLNMSEGPIWDAVNQRWFGLDGQVPFVSYDVHGMPGTWLAKDSSGNFTIKVDPTKPLSGATKVVGLPSSIAGGSISWNTYLDEYVMVYTCNGDNTNVHISFSLDGMAWGGNGIVAWEPSGGTVSYPQIVGSTDQLGGQTLFLVYDRQPATGGNNKDIVARQVTLTLPQ